MGKRWGSVILLFLSLVFLKVETLRAAPYYEGKVIQFIVGNSPGGGYDRIARLIAKHLPRHIPGNPRIIVQNMPGAASIISANYIYTIAKPDGLTIGVPGRGIPLAQLLKVEGVKYDVMKFSWIGSMAVESTVLTVRADLPYYTFADLKRVKNPLAIAGTGLGESSTQFGILLKEFAGLNIKFVFYPSGSEAMLALERKEVDGRVSSYSGIKPYIERGLVRPLIRGRAAEKGNEHLPVDEDLTTDRKGKIFMAIRSAVELVGRPYIAPPGVPPSVMKILREGFAKVTKDPEMIREAKKGMLDLEYTPAEECLKILGELFRQPSDIVRELGNYVKF